MRWSVQAGPPGEASAFSKIRACANFLAAALPAAIKSRSSHRSSVVSVTLYRFIGYLLIRNALQEILCSCTHHVKGGGLLACRFSPGCALTLLDKAIEEYQEAIRLDPNLAIAHYNLGFALHDKKELDKAIDELKKAIELEPNFGQAHAVLGDLLLMKGQFAEAKISTQKALDLLSDRDPLQPYILQHLKKCEGFLTLERKLLDVLAGKATSTDNRERLGLIEVCRLQRRYVAAARLYAATFTADAKLADDPKAAHRYNAACFAALAAAGQATGADKLADQERSRLRKQALDWLRADLDLWGKRLADGTPADRNVVQNTLQHWQDDADLTGVRDAAALKKLPAEEQEAWQKLWADIMDLLKKVGDSK